MSLGTTARLYFGQRRWLRRSTRAVFPEPTGPAILTRKARTEFWFFILWPCVSLRYEECVQGYDQNRHRIHDEPSKRMLRQSVEACGPGGRRDRARARGRRQIFQSVLLYRHGLRRAQNSS